MELLTGWEDYISIHAPHARSDKFALFRPYYEQIFQSTLLMRGATATRPFIAVHASFQSTLLMRGATRLRVMHWC